MAHLTLGAHDPEDPSPEVYVEPWQGGGWAVKLRGHTVPVSRHDTEDDAIGRAAAYRRGIVRAAEDAARREAHARGRDEEPLRFSGFRDAPGPP